MTTDRTPSTAEARADLTATLDAIEDKLNVPKQAKAKFELLREQNPNALLVGAAGVATALGLGAWAVVRAIVK